MNIGHIFFMLLVLSVLLNLIILLLGLSNESLFLFLNTITYLCIPFQLFFYFVKPLEL